MYHVHTEYLHDEFPTNVRDWPRSETLNEKKKYNWWVSDSRRVTFNRLLFSDRETFLITRFKKKKKKKNTYTWRAGRIKICCKKFSYFRNGSTEGKEWPRVSGPETVTSRPLQQDEINKGTDWLLCKLERRLQIYPIFMSIIVVVDFVSVCGLTRHLRCT